MYSNFRLNALRGNMILWSVVALALLPAIFADKVFNLDDNRRYETCEEVLHSGRYKDSGNYLIFLNSSEPIEVYCRFELGQASVPIMQQKYGRVSFQQNWAAYEYGFGSTASGDFWVGLYKIKQLTDAGYRVLTVTLQDCNNVIKVIRYNYFLLGPASDRYRLHIGSYQSSVVLPDDFSFNDNMQFATYDRQDVQGCAGHQLAGWWYNYCTYVLPTGRYYPGCYYTPTGAFYQGIYYKDWYGYGYSLKYIKMELSPY